MRNSIMNLKKSIFDTDLSDITADILEDQIDSILDDGILKKIPIVKILLSIGKTTQNIQERNLMKQTTSFIVAFNENKLSQEKIDDYNRKLNENPKLAEYELGRVLIILNKTIDTEKSIVLGNIFASYIDQKIDWNTFCELSEVNNRMFVSDLVLLKGIYDREITNTENTQSYRSERLFSLGLINTAVELRYELNNADPKDVSISELGVLYYENGVSITNAIKIN